MSDTNTRNTIINLNETEQQVIKLKILNLMEERYKEGILVSEGDFTTGAIAVMTHLTSIGKEKEEFWDLAIPWFWHIRGGRSILAELLIQRGEIKQGKIIQNRCDQRTRRIQYMDETYDLLHRLYKDETFYASDCRASIEAHLDDIGEIDIYEEEE